MRAHVAVLPGDGVGPEVTAAAVRVLQAVAKRFDHQFAFTEALIGGAAIEACGRPYPEQTQALCESAQAILLGAVGGPKWSDPRAAVRPEQGLLEIRRKLGLYANLRPVVTAPSLYPASPLKPELLDGVDIMFVRELTGGIYFGEKKRGPDYASDLCRYTSMEIDRIVRCAAELAQKRRGKLTLVDKANVLESSRLWRERTTDIVEREFPDLELEVLLVDAAAMHLLSRPADFDVIVTENLFGDILTDEASMLCGSMGMLASASIGGAHTSLYEPIHGSAPDIAGHGIANPCGAILSAALMLRHAFGLETEAHEVEAAVARTIEAGVVTPDIAGIISDGEGAGVTTDQATQHIVDAMQVEDRIQFA